MDPKNASTATATKRSRKGAWVHIKVADIVAYKDKERISWGVTAKRLGVAAETLRMWRNATSTPGLTKQAAVKAIMAGKQPHLDVPPMPARTPKPAKAPKPKAKRAVAKKTDSGRLTIQLVGADDLDAVRIAEIVMQALKDANVQVGVVIQAA